MSGFSIARWVTNISDACRIPINASKNFPRAIRARHWRGIIPFLSSSDYAVATETDL